MLDARMIGRVVYDTYRFRQLVDEAKVLYTYLILNCDNDGICDRIYDILTLNNIKHTALTILIEANLVYPIGNEITMETAFWLPDFLSMNVISNTKGYAPSRYRNELRMQYPWAPVLVVRDREKGYIRTDIINDNDILDPDPRTGKIYETPRGQKPRAKDIEHRKNQIEEAKNIKKHLIAEQT